MSRPLSVGIHSLKRQGYSFRALSIFHSRLVSSSLVQCHILYLHQIGTHDSRNEHILSSPCTNFAGIHTMSNIMSFKRITTDAENALNTNSQPASKKPKWQIEKEEYLKMPISEKRRIYKAEYVTLDSVPTWPEYYKKISKELKGKPSKVPVDEELNSKVSLWCGDITTLEIDCIVNAANELMLGGSGVDGAIHSAAGPTLLAECRTVHGCKTGDAKITGGYKLPAKYIIHTVGPRYHGDEKLRNCYKKSLDLMIENNLRSIAFPCISTGIYGFPGERAADIAVTTVRDFLQNHRDKVDRVIFCLFTRQDIYIYESTMQTYFPVEGKHRDYEDQMSDDHPNANPRGKPSDKSSVPKL